MCELHMALFLKNICLSYLSFFNLSKAGMELYINKAFLLAFLKVLKLCTYVGLKTLVDIVLVDFLKGNTSFKLIYNLLNLKGVRVSVLTFLEEMEFCASIVGLYKSAGWAEREVWDMFGVYFVNHGDLRRILTDYGFSGFPFSKDFPLTGYIELRFDDQKGDIVYEPVELSQEMRFFNFATGWETD